MKCSIICLFVLLPFLAIAAESQVYYQVKAKPGDGIYALMRRHHLDKYSCNFDQFYRLNKLKKNAHLVVGRNYYLPILLYAFNGKTIRSSIGVNDWDLAVRIQTYNEQMLEEKMRETSFKKDKTLWVPFHELNCPSQDLDVAAPVDLNPESTTPAGRGRSFPIFGPKYANTPVQSNRLKGKVFYIVGGHGGPDPGAIGKRGNYTLCEDEYAYDVALRLCRNLIANGATAYMVIRDEDDGIREDKFLKCDTDEIVWGNIPIHRSQKPRLFQRSDVINDLYEKHRLQGVAEQKVIAIHVDSRSGGERTDVFFYHYPGDDNGRRLAQHMQRSLKQKYKQYQQNRQYHGTVTGRDLHMLRETIPTSVYIELGNIKNTNDQQRLILAKNRQYLADWLFEGLLK